MSGEPRTKRLLLVAGLVVLAGCTGFLPGGSEYEVPDELGEVDGVSYDDDIAVDPEDGFTEEELDRFVTRTMARIEAVRELDFKRPVDVEIISRDEYRDRQAVHGVGTTGSAWENQIWQALFIIGQDRDANQVIDDAFDDAVQGYYQPGENQIVIVSDAERPTVSKQTLVHELVHALQEQQFGLELGQGTRDEQAAYDALVEGEAQLVTRLYLEDWCDQWDCIRPEADTDGTQAPQIEPGLAMLISQPYTQGVEFVDSVRESGGWEAVNELHEDPPRSTAATGDTDRGVDSSPEQVTIPDRSNPSWERFDNEPTGDTLGAVSLYAMFAANGVIENTDPANYAHPVVDGWTGDRIVPYRNGEMSGFVWELAWQSAGDAEQFADGYRDLLDSNGALARGAADYVIQSGPYEGAYRVTVDGERVRIISGPDRNSLNAIFSR